MGCPRKEHAKVTGYFIECTLQNQSCQWMFFLHQKINNIAVEMEEEIDKCGTF